MVEIAMTRRAPRTQTLSMRRETSTVVPSQALQVREINPGPPRRRSMKRMVGQGTQVLARMIERPEFQADAAAREHIMRDWDALSEAWSSHDGDRRCALTRFQETLSQWTADYPWVAADEPVQHYRRQLHLTLDH